MANRIQTPKPHDFNPELYQFRLDELQKSVDKNTDVTTAILEKVNSLAYVKLDDFEDYKTKQDSRMDAFEKYVERTYRKKEDGKVLRNVAISVLTSVIILIVTIVVNFIFKGGFSGASQ